MSGQRSLLAFPAFLTLVILGASVMASDRSDEEVLGAIWRSPDDSVSYFNDHFLGEVPPGQIKSILIDGVERCGALIAIERAEEAGKFRMITERCEIPTAITRDGEGKIDGLLFHHAVRRDASLDDLLEQIATFEGDVSYAIFENGEQIAGRDSDRPMAVGSAFKLIVLAALHERIEAGDAKWSDVVTLEKKHISLTSSLLQNMPIGSPFTLHTLAAAMIAESDNTATDVLIDVVGRGRLETLSGLRPFLTTREVFQLKADEVAYRRYEQAALPERYAVLDALAKEPLPSVHRALPPWQAEAEWLLSTETLCRWIERVAVLDLTRINTGVLRSADWKYAAYKGGSETGVMNMTTLARDQQNRDFCVSVTWNTDQSIYDEPLTGLYTALFHQLKRRP